MIVNDIQESKKTIQEAEDGKEKLMLDAQKKSLKFQLMHSQKFDYLLSQAK